MRKRFRILVIIVAILLVPTSATLVAAQDGTKEIIKVRGSDSMAALVDSYANEFMKSRPNVNVVVSGGKELSFDALLDRECDIIMASRRIYREENETAAKKGLDLQGKVVAWGGIVVIVNPQNPINELTVDQVRKIFLGQYINWQEIGGPSEPIAILTVGEQRGGTLDFVRHDFLKAPFASNAVTKMYFRSIISDVSEEGAATSFVRVRNILQLTAQGLEKKVKVIAVKKDEQSPAVLPSRETCNNGTYPICRPYFLYVDQKSAGKFVRDFFEFCCAKNPRPL